MDWIYIVYLVILIGCSITIFVATFSLKDDERRKCISRKAQSYSIMVVFGIFILEAIARLHLTLHGNAPAMGQGVSPIAFLTVISSIYLATLLFYRKKYGDLNEEPHSHLAEINGLITGRVGETL